MALPEVSKLAEELFLSFEKYLVEKYGLVDIHGHGKASFMKGSDLVDSNESETGSNPDTGDLNPLRPEPTPIQTPNTAPYMYEPKPKGKREGVKKSESKSKESKLETQALETECPVGPHQGVAFRDAWHLTKAGESTIRVLAKSQLDIAKTAAVVVKFFDQTDGEE